jgi:hypothetical protein
MSRLEQLIPGAPVRDPGEWLGDQAVKVTFEEPNGTVRSRMVYWTNEPALELVELGRRRWLAPSIQRQRSSVS